MQPIGQSHLDFLIFKIPAKVVIARALARSNPLLMGIPLFSGDCFAAWGAAARNDRHVLGYFFSYAFALMQPVLQAIYLQNIPISITKTFESVPTIERLMQDSRFASGGNKSLIFSDEPFFILERNKT